MTDRKPITPISSLIGSIHGRKTALECVGLNGSERAYLVSRILRASPLPFVVILPTVKALHQFSEELGYFSHDVPHQILTFPPYNVMPHKSLDYHHETSALRISTLHRMLEDPLPTIVLTTVGAVLKKVVPKRELLDYAELVMAHEEIDREGLVEKLVSGGYFQSAIVEEPGDFSVRGGILDLFSPLYQNPLRIEFFGDIIDTIRFFDAASQRKIGEVDEAVILPARETIVGPDKINPIVTRLRGLAAELEIKVTETREWIDRVRNERVFTGLESLLPVVYSQPDTFFDYVSDESLFLLLDPGDLERAGDDFMEQVAANYTAAMTDAKFCVPPEFQYLNWSAARNIIDPRHPIALKSLAVSKIGVDADHLTTRHEFQVNDNSDLTAELKRTRKPEGLLSPLISWITENRRIGAKVIMVCRTRSQVERLGSLLNHYDVRPEAIDDVPDIATLAPGIYIGRGDLSCGFIWQKELLAVVTAEEIFSTASNRPVRSVSRSKAAKIGFQDLKKGDLVVHVEHGIGAYQGLSKLRVDGITNDFLLILYKGGDKLYLPVDRMGLIQKYMGVEGVKPVLSKMGGKSWEKIKSRIRRSAEKIAGELLKLYAARKVEKGYAFGRSDEIFREFEAGFPYEETRDQKKAIEDVLNDMESSTPMDRLVCGDVGYGKTEVALRASFKAVNEGKQVAVLVPTTVLAEQHFRSFSDRFHRYPIEVACLTRFRTVKEMRRILAGLKEGTIDIVIGTHRLLQKDVVFKDPGLLVFDEEHRFGVKHKEKLKKLKQSIDVLALTATPIPRTLHLSLTGVRDISTIETAPEDRRAIITYISEFNEAVVVSAIRKEMDRQGQIFFIHNNIHSIDAMANRLQELVPEARLDIAHGRMNEEDLEQVMFRFLNAEIDMLVCTTIVESGLDIPSANSILINRADRMGLAQMYQLRGRVGRADEQAFAYLFIPPESHLSKDAQKRLKVLMEHSDLGAGFQIAMNDLKIRGGGTILGASQSGHIAAVGYDLFLQLMEQAIGELKGQPVIEALEPEINIPYSSFIPESYIPDFDQRLSAYRRLVKMASLSEIAAFKDELADRFGVLPSEAGNLLLKIMLRILSKQAGVKRIDLNEKQLTLRFSRQHSGDPEKIFRRIDLKGLTCQIPSESVCRIPFPKNLGQSRLALTRNILKEISQHGNA